MSFEDIKIHRDFPIKNGFVQVPPNEPLDNIAVDGDNATGLVAGSEVTRLSLGSGKPTGSKHGQQEFLRLPGISPNEWYSTDPVDDLNGP
jgi:hypothetical protein